jgi:hydroxymethylpyrimidine/phosphomethylpyrimidine kinase
MDSPPSPALPPIVLAFAATDPSGGAGLQADVMTLASMGCHPLSVVTAVTIQDTMGVEEVMALDAEWVADQARCVLEDMPVAAFKIGLLGSTENISAIAEVVSDYPEIPLVLDPVLASGRGDELVTDEMISALRELLIPQTTIITPNSIEARRLVQEEGEDDVDLAECARRLLAMGCEYVLITGTHENTAQVVNTLYGQRGALRQLGTARRQLPRFRVHARVGDRGDDRQWTEHQRRGKRCAGIHVANPQIRVPARHGSAHPRSIVLGTRGRTHRCSRLKGCTQ